jgi:hypothetical protein
VKAIPTAGPDRDVEIARRLGVDTIESIAIDLDLPEGATAPFSTSRVACDALVAAMKGLGYGLQKPDRDYRTLEMGRAELLYASFARPARQGGPAPLARGRDYCDAVSTAALLALWEQ